MKHKKRTAILSLLLSALLLFFLFSGCGSGTSKDDSKDSGNAGGTEEDIPDADFPESGGGEDLPESDLPLIIESKFGVGAGKMWEPGYVVPYVDITLYSSDKTYANNGALNLVKMKQETGLRYFNVGFITDSNVGADKKLKTVSGKTVINWSFGGYEELTEGSADPWQYSGIKKSIKDIRNSGGDVAISIGGYTGQGFFSVTNSVEIYENTYKSIIEGFGLTRLDLDIEEGAQYVNHEVSAEALKRVQDVFHTEVVLTLPVFENGLDIAAKNVIKAYISKGVKVKLVNIMTMCYGSHVSDYAAASITAIDNAMKNVKELYRGINVNLSDADAYSLLGFTTAIGYTAGGFPIFTTQMTKRVVEHAKEKGLGLASYWSLNRDSTIWSNRGIYSKYEHTLLYKQYFKF